MGSTDNKKTKRRKNKKPSKPSTNCHQASQSLQSIQIPTSNPEEEINQMQQLMDADVRDTIDNSGIPQLPQRGPNPYLVVDRCLLCHCQRPDNVSPASPTQDVAEDDQDSGVASADVDGAQASDEGSLSQLWVCAECRKTVEEEEEKRASVSIATLLDREPRRYTPPLPLFPPINDASAETASVDGSVCNCEACTERRLIEKEHEVETQELQQCWMELRHVVRYVYREAGTGLAEGDDAENSGMSDTKKMKQLVERLVQRDPHQLFQRLELQGREFVLEMKERLLRQLSSGHKTPPQARQFVAMMLEEYSNLCSAAKTLAYCFTQMEQEHLKRFNLTWELHNKHLFQSLIYMDSLVQNSLPMLITQLRLGAASKEAYQEDNYRNVLTLYLKFDDEMSVISVIWRDCQQLIDSYNDEQTALKAKQKMLKEDWEFFKAQRKLLEQTILKHQSPPTTSSASNSAHTLESQFTETMRHILQGTKPSVEEYVCPNCNHKRCPCDECSISHMITCGLINPEVQDQLPVHQNPMLFPASRYIIDITPPSMSSTSSSSGSADSPAEQQDRLELTEDAVDVSTGAKGESEICNVAAPLCDTSEGAAAAAEDTGGGQSSLMPDEASGASAAAEDTDEQDDVKEDLDEDDEEDEDGDGDDEDEEEDELDEDEEDDDDDDDYEDEDEDEEEEDDEEEEEESENKVIHFGALPSALGAAESCDCTHCIRHDQLPKPAEDSCQCHACLQQCSKTMATSLPQHLPAAPRPAALHLYPHIHGSNNIQAAAHTVGAGHIRPLIQPHLYELHNPLHPQAKSTLVPSSVSSSGQNQTTGGTMVSTAIATLGLELEGHGIGITADMLQEHLYNVCDWDSNSISATPKAVQKFTPGGISSELFNAPLPPLLNGSPFLSDLSVAAMDTSLANVVKTSTVLQHYPSTSKPMTTTTVTTATGLLTSLCGDFPTSSTATITSASSSPSLQQRSFATTTPSSSSMSMAPCATDFLKNIKQPINRNLFQATGLSTSPTHKPILMPSSTPGTLPTPVMVTTVTMAPASLSTASNPSLTVNQQHQAEFCLKRNYLHASHLSAANCQPPNTALAASLVSSPQSTAASGIKLGQVNEEAYKMFWQQGKKSLQQHACSHSGALAPVSSSSATAPNFMQLAAQAQAAQAAQITAVAAAYAVQSSAATEQLQPSSGGAVTGASSPMPETAVPNVSVASAMASLNSLTNLTYSSKNVIETTTTCAASPPTSTATTPANPPVTTQHCHSQQGPVSVGTSTLCNDPACDGHHGEENYDSIDDSCSEQSSSTSNSNQKDSKYCDCCYCEFFGHSTPPTLPTSRNYPEMREKLRLRLKKKNEAKCKDTEPDKIDCIQPAPAVELPVKPVEQVPEVTVAPVKKEPLDQKGLDELIRFINGGDHEQKAKELVKPVSSKAAKRARQKQKKAEERAKKEAEERTKAEQQKSQKKKCTSPDFVGGGTVDNDVGIAVRGNVEAHKENDSSQVPAPAPCSKARLVSPSVASCTVTATSSTSSKTSNCGVTNPTTTPLSVNVTNSSACIVPLVVQKKRKGKHKEVPVANGDGSVAEASISCPPAQTRHSKNMSSSKVQVVSSRSTIVTNPTSIQTNQPITTPHTSKPSSKVTVKNSNTGNSISRNGTGPTPLLSLSPKQPTMKNTNCGAAGTKRRAGDGQEQENCHKNVQRVLLPRVEDKGDNKRGINTPSRMLLLPQTQQLPQQRPGQRCAARSETASPQVELQNRKNLQENTMRPTHANNKTNRTAPTGGESVNHKVQPHAQQKPPPLSAANNNNMPLNTNHIKITTQSFQANPGTDLQHGKKGKNKKSPGNYSVVHPNSSPSQHTHATTPAQSLLFHAGQPVPNTSTNPMAMLQPTTTPTIKPRQQLPQKQQPSVNLVNGNSSVQKQTLFSTRSPAVPKDQTFLRAMKVNSKEAPAIMQAGRTSGGSQEDNVGSRIEDKSPRQEASNGKSKKNKRRNKTVDDLDEIFMPKEDVENGEMDEFEREIEEFKRFCLDSNPMPKQEKLQVNVNLKDIFSKKKSGLGCA